MKKIKRVMAIKIRKTQRKLFKIKMKIRVLSRKARIAPPRRKAAIVFRIKKLKKIAIVLKTKLILNKKVAKTILRKKISLPHRIHGRRFIRPKYYRPRIHGRRVYRPRIPGRRVYRPRIYGRRVYKPRIYGRRVYRPRLYKPRFIRPIPKLPLKVVIAAKKGSPKAMKLVIKKQTRMMKKAIVLAARARKFELKVHKLKLKLKLKAVPRRMKPIIARKLARVVVIARKLRFKAKIAIKAARTRAIAVKKLLMKAVHQSKILIAAQKYAKKIFALRLATVKSKLRAARHPMRRRVLYKKLVFIKGKMVQTKKILAKLKTKFVKVRCVIRAGLIKLAHAKLVAFKKKSAHIHKRAAIRRIHIATLVYIKKAAQAKKVIKKIIRLSIAIRRAPPAAKHSLVVKKHILKRKIVVLIKKAIAAKAKAVILKKTLIAKIKAAKIKARLIAVAKMIKFAAPHKKARLIHVVAKLKTKLRIQKRKIVAVVRSIRAHKHKIAIQIVRKIKSVIHKSPRIPRGYPRFKGVFRGKTFKGGVVLSPAWQKYHMVRSRIAKVDFDLEKLIAKRIALCKKLRARKF